MDFIKLHFFFLLKPGGWGAYSIYFKHQTELLTYWPKIGSSRVCSNPPPSLWHFSLALWHELSLLFYPISAGKLSLLWSFCLSLMCTSFCYDVSCGACPTRSVGGTLMTVSRCCLLMRFQQRPFLLLASVYFVFFLSSMRCVSYSQYFKADFIYFQLHVSLVHVSAPCPLTCMAFPGGLCPCHLKIAVSALKFLSCLKWHWRDM